MEYQGIVTSENDPKGYKRVQVRVPELFPEDLISKRDLPWATYRLPLLAHFNEGAFVSARVGDNVWIDFPYLDSDGHEDTTRPRITGWVHECPDGLPTIPHETFNGPASLEGLHERPDDSDIEQPENNQPADAISLWGIVLEFLRNQTFRITQKSSKTSIEISKSGHGGFYAQGNLFLTARDKLKLIGSEISITARKLLKLTVTALEMKLLSMVVDVSGKLLINGKGGTKITGADVNVASMQGNMALNAAGLLALNASGANKETVTIDTTLSPDNAKVIEVSLAGAVLARFKITTTGDILHESVVTGAKTGMETGLLVAENAGGSIKGQFEELMTKFEEMIDASKDVIIDTGTGPGKVNASSVQAYVQIKTGMAQLKATLATIMK